MTPSVDVRDVDAAVGAQKSVMRLGDEHAVFAADRRRLALAKGEFDHARIEIVLFGPRDGFFGWVDRFQIDDAALGFGDDLVFDHENVAGLEADSGGTQAVEQAVGKRVAGGDFARDGDRKNSQGGERRFFRPFGAPSALDAFPRLAPWAAFFRRFAAGTLRARVTRPFSHPAFRHRHIRGPVSARGFRLAGKSTGAGLRDCRHPPQFQEGSNHARLARCLRRGMMRLEAVIAEAKRK